MAIDTNHEKCIRSSERHIQQRGLLTRFCAIGSYCNCPCEAKFEAAICDQQLPLRLIDNSRVPRSDVVRTNDSRLFLRPSGSCEDVSQLRGRFSSCSYTLAYRIEESDPER